MASRGSHLNEIIFHYYREGLYFQIKKRNLRKYSVVFFLKHFAKEKVFGGPVTLQTEIISVIIAAVRIQYQSTKSIFTNSKECIYSGGNSETFEGYPKKGIWWTLYMCYKLCYE